MAAFEIEGFNLFETDFKSLIESIHQNISRFRDGNKGCNADIANLLEQASSAIKSMELEARGNSNIDVKSSCLTKLNGYKQKLTALKFEYERAKEKNQRYIIQYLLFVILYLK
jgi:hypothetical protein